MLTNLKPHLTFMARFSSVSSIKLIFKYLNFSTKLLQHMQDNTCKQHQTITRLLLDWSKEAWTEKTPAFPVSCSSSSPNKEKQIALLPLQYHKSNLLQVIDSESSHAQFDEREKTKQLSDSCQVIESVHRQKWPVTKFLDPSEDTWRHVYLSEVRHSRHQPITWRQWNFWNYFEVWWVNRHRS